ASEGAPMKLSRHLLAAAALALAAQLPVFSDAALAADKVCKLEIEGNDLLQFNKKELVVEGDCTQVELTLVHTGKLPVQSMGHNWVLTRTADSAAVGSAGLSAGPKNDYVPQ